MFLTVSVLSWSLVFLDHCCFPTLLRNNCHCEDGLSARFVLSHLQVVLTTYNVLKEEVNYNKQVKYGFRNDKRYQ